MVKKLRWRGKLSKAISKGTTPLPPGSPNRGRDSLEQSLWEVHKAEKVIIDINDHVRENKDTHLERVLKGGRGTEAPKHEKSKNKTRPFRSKVACNVF